MFKSIKRLFDFIKTERTFKFMAEKYHAHVKEFPNLANLAFDIIGLKVSIYGRFENDELLKCLREINNINFTGTRASPPPASDTRLNYC